MRPRDERGRFAGSTHDWDYIWELSQQGLSAKQIAMNVGCSVKTVSRVRVHFDPSRSNPNKHLDQRDDWTPELRAKIKAALEDRQGYSKVEQTFGIKRETLERHFPGYGLTLAERAEMGVLARKFNQLNVELTVV